jgi:hypothetical protein
MHWLDFLFSKRIESRRQFLAGLSPVVLMGRGHSGTRVLSWACTHLGVRLGTLEESRAGDVQDLHLQDEILRVARCSLGITRAEQVPPAALRRFQRAVFDYYQHLGNPAGLWGWKFPESYLIGPCIDATFPRARYIHLVRDGRDVAFKQHLTDNPKRSLGRAILKSRGSLRLPHHLQAAVSWEFQVEQFEAFGATLNEGQVLKLTFNELCTRPAVSADRVCRFLQIPMTAACRRYIEQEINPAKVDEYRSADSRQVREVEKLVGPTLRRHGFIH